MGYLIWMQLPEVYETEPTASSQYMEVIPTCHYRNKSKVENINMIYTPLDYLLLAVPQVNHLVE